MIRIFLWKLGFEWSHLMRAFFPHPHEKIYYFAFGANLSPDIINKRRIQIFESFDYALPDSILRFSQPGIYKDHGYASADPHPGSVVYGKMYLILKSDAQRMDYYEGYPFLRVHDKITVSDNDIEFFYYRSLRPNHGFKPTPEYLSYIVDAYRSMPIVPKEYVTQLANTAVVTEYVPQTYVGKYVRNIQKWPSIFIPWLLRYERLSSTIVHYLWNRSCVLWMIKQYKSGTKHGLTD